MRRSQTVFIINSPAMNGVNKYDWTPSNLLNLCRHDHYANL